MSITTGSSRLPDPVLLGMEDLFERGGSRDCAQEVLASDHPGIGIRDVSCAPRRKFIPQV
jgi:hypothetical protein